MEVLLNSFVISKHLDGDISSLKNEPQEEHFSSSSEQMNFAGSLTFQLDADTMLWHSGAP